MKSAGLHGLAILAVLTLPAIAAPEAPPVSVTEDATQIVLDNGIVGITASKEAGVLKSIRARVNGIETELGNGSRAMLYDFDNHSRQHVNFGQSGANVRLVSGTPNAADVSVTSEPTAACPFKVDIHWILRRGDSGFYSYIVFRHTKGMPACTFEQTRAVIRGVRGMDVCTHFVVDDKRKAPYPVGPALREIADTTWLYPNDSEPHSKYEYTNFIGDDLVHGMAGNGIGLWLIAPSREYVNGGPLRQELTSHQDTPTSPKQNNILLWMLQGNHFGGPNMNIAQDEEWTRFYGPAIVYINQAFKVDDLWEDAKQKASREEDKWPYAFVQNPDYPLERGTVSGQIELTNKESAKGAWVVLGASGDLDWCMSSHDYMFWAKADANGHFSIPKVRPGRYTLFVSGGNQFEDFRQENVQVSAGQNSLGKLLWKPVTHGRTIWQIGTPDRSSQEFAQGKDVRHYTNYLRYGKNFPNDVTFVVGRDDESKDWNFAQWGWYAKQPYWAVQFNQLAALKGKATLTLSFAAFQYPRGLQVRLNGQDLGVIKLQKSGMAAYRCGGQDSLRQIASVTFDANLIKAGANELQLALIDTVRFDTAIDTNPSKIGVVMYDALRLEVDTNYKQSHKPSKLRIWQAEPKS